MANNKKFYGSDGAEIKYTKKEEVEDAKVSTVEETDKVEVNNAAVEQIIMDAIKEVNPNDIPKAITAVKDLKSGIEKLYDLKILPEEISAEVKNMTEIMDKFEKLTDRSEELNKQADVKSTEGKKNMKAKNKNKAKKEFVKAKKEITSGQSSSKWIPALVASGAALATTGFDIVVSGDTSMQRLIGTAAATAVAGGLQYGIQSTLTNEQSTLVNCGVGAAVGAAVGGSARLAVDYFGNNADAIEADL